ncbi:hypothetical protein CRP01_20765 [Flavilitoribacter nigricans DSM 23189 = NBRC 102662]|uniref:Bacterial surface antigen (D15) domain-containing protein n=1 Tax=Flavilitoribacter nigricans (strain ATCC 23147 / DSM 23189 / NBRC 102662 / NCIMB 1420 / SS-2) TaxID=1122177 RepID=A0A2D0N9I6_FLAN2|nr:hypothetical protein CRP01_20765 [Flavilitoribacter nigricans DSM 23189 = NBRC 102662]
MASCANYRLNYAPEVENWEQESTAPDSEQPYSLYLIGDVGEASKKGTVSGYDLLVRHLDNRNEESGIIFLGNNLDRKKKKTSKDDLEKELLGRLEKIKDFPGDLFFLPGESDWAIDGLEGIDWQQELIEDYLDRDDIWVPKPGCSGPEEIDLTENVVLLLADSEWYLRDWEGEIDINNDCDVKSRDVFRWLVNEEMKSNRHKNTVVAMHHPLISYGPHGGSHHIKEHLFPLTAVNENLYVPLPIVGSLTTFLRASIGNRRDIVHPVYQELVDAFMNPARQNGRFIFAGAHDQSLQHIERDSQVFIVSGAGSSKTTAVHTGKDSDFAYSRPGFSKIDFYENGSAWVEYWVTDPYEKDGKLVYRKQIKEPFPEKVDPPEPYFDPIAPGETVKVNVSDRNYQRGGFWRFLFGEHYRDVYHAEIEVPLFDLTRFNGGVEPVKRGGGAQTNSLRLEDKAGRQYNLRSIDKDATRTVPYPFNKSVVLGLVEDNFSASHPLGALASAKLSEVVDIPHTKPQVVYLPRQAALGDYNDDYADALYLIEERPDDEVWEDDESYGFPEDIEDTEGMLEEIHEDHDRVLDDEMLVFYRLFDMMIGDWDRHDDQWQWGQHDEDSLTVYRPIPRDRDQVFSHYDGASGFLVRQTAPVAKQFKPFRARIRNTKWDNYGAHFLDQTMLTGLEWSDWEAAVKHLQEAFTDEVIAKALKDAWPESIYSISGPEILRKTISRRDQLMDAARERYLFLARRVDVVGTTERDLFLVEQLDNDRIRVRVYDTNDEREKEFLFFDRTFLKKETKEISLYALDDEDVFELKGNGKGGPRLNLLGGLGEDIYENDGMDLPMHIYDTDEEEKTEIKGDNGFTRHLSDDPTKNIYDRKAPAYEYNFGSYFPSFAFNPEDGLFLGFNAKYTTYGFKKAPFASLQNLNVGFALQTKGVVLNYKGIFTDLFGLWDFQLGLDAQTPLYTNNFYGYGNNTVDFQVTEDRDRDYHRIRLAKASLYPALLRKYNSGATLEFGPTLEYFQLDNSTDRFIGTIEESLPGDIFEPKWYGGVRGIYNYRNQDDNIRPTRGIAAKVTGGWKKQFSVPGQQFSYLNASFSFYQKLEPKGRIVFATRVGVDHRFNDRFEFYQASTIGGSGPEANFRGLRRDRFTGRSAFYQNIDLRVTILNSGDWALPMSVGILGGFDHGRIWSQADETQGGRWHSSYGGGLWLSPLNIFMLNLSVFRNEADQYQFTVLGSYFF